MPLFLRPYALVSTVPVEWSKAESPQLARGEGGYRTGTSDRRIPVGQDTVWWEERSEFIPIFEENTQRKEGKGG